MALNFLDELDITSTGDTVLQGFDKCQDNFEWLDDLFHGYARRSKFRWKDADEIYIGAGVYHHEGTVNQLLYCNSELTFKLGSAGSNSDSDDLTASAWHYIYIDDTAVVTAGTKLLTETEFRNETTAPTWSASKHGWYSGDDRCVFAVLTSAGSAVLEFYHTTNLVIFGIAISGAYAGSPSSTFTDATLDIPGFCTEGYIRVDCVNSSAVSQLEVRPNDQTGSSGIEIYHSLVSASQYATLARVITNSSQICEVRFNNANSGTVGVSTNGWYFPEGM